MLFVSLFREYQFDIATNIMYTRYCLLVARSTIAVPHSRRLNINLHRCVRMFSYIIIYQNHIPHNQALHLLKRFFQKGQVCDLHFASRVASCATRSKSSITPLFQSKMKWNYILQNAWHHLMKARPFQPTTL